MPPRTRPVDRRQGAGKPALREQLTTPGVFAVIAELVAWRGALTEESMGSALGVAEALAEDPRIGALSVTDNAGGHAMLSPQTLAERFLDRGQDVIVHVACRDRSRMGLQSLAWDLQSRHLTNVLAVTGDYPVEGYGGLSRPVFDIDSVGLLKLYSEMDAPAAATGGAGAAAAPGAGAADPAAAGAPLKASAAAGTPAKGAGAAGAPASGGQPFFLGVAVNNRKRFEREVMPQYYKLALKIRSGADFVISQVGYDARKDDELLRYMRLRSITRPTVANAYILTGGVARTFHAGKIPGCVVTDDLLALAERQAASPDKGKAFFLEFAAKQMAIARGLGYQGIYLSGHRRAEDLLRVLDLEASFGPDDWKAFAREISFGFPDGFYVFEPDPDTGLNTAQVNRAFLRSRTRRARRLARLQVPFDYHMSRLVHDLIYTPGTPGFRLGTAAYERIERLHLDRPLHVLEQAAKVPLYDCRDCGDCSLPDIAYLCPESRCPKDQRNGPCGGTHDAICEVEDHPCIWSLAYDRLKPYGDEDAMLRRPPVIQDNALRRTSAWANTYLGRDHFARRASEE